jgi:hypothetical protein
MTKPLPFTENGTTATRKPRRNAFKQCDVARAIKAAFAGGATSVKIEVAGLVVVAENSQFVDKATHSVNEWDEV